MTTIAMTLPKKTSQLLTALTGAARADAALALIMRDYAHYKLAEIEAALQTYEKKYGMPFAAYRQRWETQETDEDYTYEAEQDYLEWEGLITRRARLEESLAWLP
jgi:hypothetical protein